MSSLAGVDADADADADADVRCENNKTTQKRLIKGMLKKEKVLDPHEEAVIYAPQGVDLGGGGSPSEWNDTEGCAPFDKIVEALLKVELL